MHENELMKCASVAEVCSLLSALALTVFYLYKMLKLNNSP